ncbi:unnamed protein product [Echinostoma caproni]|uniref:PEROXIDASE_4 domain-containing protein n=1 Tax=Echinostoma caproni TaxID=27848 RepID=A0A183AZE0_9TREM|nr:unnamed protein product [Echinostoma caproni]
MDQADSFVAATWDDEMGLFSTRITLPGDTYFLEITLFHRLNALYQSAKFLLDETVEEAGYGFLLADIIIHDTWTKKLGHYNAPSDVGGKAWTAVSLSNFTRGNESRGHHGIPYSAFLVASCLDAARELEGVDAIPSRN